MHLRSIRLKILVWQGAGYRIFIVISEIGFLWLVTGKLTFAVSVSIIWNAINMGLYYLYHYLFARLFKLGKRKEGEK